MYYNIITNQPITTNKDNKMSNIITKIATNLIETEYFFGNKQTLEAFINKNINSQNQEAVYIQNQYAMKEFEGTLTGAIQYLINLQSDYNVSYLQCSFWHSNEQNEKGQYLLISLNITEAK